MLLSREIAHGNWVLQKESGILAFSLIALLAVVLLQFRLT